jgi:DNA-binding HxlR family transcriptional regulator
MEVLDERWMMLVLRELLLGSSHFNEVRRGVPRMSPALLSKRLQTLVKAGVVERHVEGKRVTYHLTPAGRELMPVLEAIGRWGLRWMRELYDEDLDPFYLLWDIRRSIDLEEVPDTTTVLSFRFSDVDPSVRQWWMVIRREGVDICDFDQGYEVLAYIEASLRTLTRLWRGDFSWREKLRSGEVRIDGGPVARRLVPRLLGRSFLAGTPRPAVGTA